MSTSSDSLNCSRCDTKRIVRNPALSKKASEYEGVCEGKSEGATDGIMVGLIVGVADGRRLIVGDAVGDTDGLWLMDGEAEGLKETEGDSEGAKLAVGLADTVGVDVGTAVGVTVGPLVVGDRLGARVTGEIVGIAVSFPDIGDWVTGASDGTSVRLFAVGAGVVCCPHIDVALDNNINRTKIILLGFPERLLDFDPANSK